MKKISRRFFAVLTFFTLLMIAIDFPTDPKMKNGEFQNAENNYMHQFETDTAGKGQKPINSINKNDEKKHFGENYKFQEMLKIQKLTPEGDFMFGYHNKKETMLVNKIMLVLVGEIPFNNKEPDGNDNMVVGWISTSKEPVFHRLGETLAWNLQQGCMMEWINETHVIYNVRENGFRALVHALDGGNEIYPRPVYALTRDRYISVSFERLHNVRPGYGYAVPFSQIDPCPNNDGIWLVDLKTKKEELLFSYYDIWIYLNKTGNHDEYTKYPHNDHFPSSGKYYWWVHSIVWSKDSRYISFITKASAELHKTDFVFSTLLMADVSKRELWRVPVVRGRYQYFGTFLLNCEYIGTYKIIYRQSVQKLKWNTNSDSQCSLSPDENWLITDTYSHPNRTIFIEQLFGDKKYPILKYQWQNNESIHSRCDFYPRWNFDGKAFFFDLITNGNRGVYAINLPVNISTLPSSDAVRDYGYKGIISSNLSLKKKDIKPFIFIDLGARNGDTIDWYLETFPKRRPSIIWGFEANPQNFMYIDKYFLRKRNNVDIRFIKKAAWIHDKGVQFFLVDQEILGSGTIFNHDQTYLQNTTKIAVPSLDFSSWLLNNTSPYDDVILKMDIEGAEYDLLNKMFADKSINRINTLIIEWHDRFMPGKSHREFEKKIRNLNIRFIRWY